MKRKLLLFTLFTLIATSAFSAQQVVLQPSSEAFTIAVPISDSDQSILHYEINSFGLDAVSIDGREYSLVSLGKRAMSNEVGMPALPTLRESIQIPDNAEMAVRVIDAEYKDYTGVAIVPAKGPITRNIDPALVAYKFDAFYGQDAWYPSELTRLDAPYIMRDTRGVVVEVNPFRYNPATETLRVYTSITVVVEAIGPGKVNVLTQRPANRVAEFERIYDRHYLNYGQGADRYESVPEMGRMMIVTHDSFRSAVEPLVAWKNQLGIQTDIINMSEVGSTGNQLKSFVQDCYNTDGVCFVLLVGDDVHIPYLMNDGDAADPMQGLLAGNDSYPEAFIGRMSAENIGHVQTQVTKAIEYERDAQAAADWYHKGIGIASAEGNGIGDDGEADWVHMNNIRTDLLDFTYTDVNQIYDTNGGNATQLANAVNEGRSFINYVGHGSTTAWSTTGFSNTHVNNLVNDNKLPFICSVACVNGNFTNSTCFAEAWLRATNGGEPSGAVGMYASTINQQWAPPMCGQDEVTDLLVSDAKRTLGGLLFNGSCQMMDEYGGNGQSEFKNWTIFGDPSLRVRTDTPTAMAISHDDSIDPEATSFTVQTEADALVGLSDSGVYLGSAIADAGGVAVVTLVAPLGEREMITVTVSNFNRFTSSTEIEVGSMLLPSCDVSPPSFSETLLVDSVFQTELFLSNFGQPGSMLDYSLVNLNLDTPLGGEADWLSLDSYAGAVPYSETDTRTLTLDATGLADGQYTAQICVSNNAPGGMILVPVVLNVTSDATAVGDAPAALGLGQNYPNPFNPKTNISLALSQSGNVRLEIFDAAGRSVRMLVDGSMNSGHHTLEWDGTDGAGNALGTGVYFYRLDAEGQRMTRKMLLLK